MTVRIAVPEDEDRLYGLLLQLSDDNGFGVAISEDRVREQIRIGTEKRGGFIGVIDGPNETIIASVGIFMTSWWYSDDIYLGEVWLFVSPDYRLNRFERELFGFSLRIREQMSAAMGRPVALVTSVSAPRRLPAKTRLWRRLSGGKQVGSIFVIE